MLVKKYKKLQAGGIFDSTNPFWNQAYQFTPRVYSPLGINEELQLINQEPKPDALPDFSKIKDQLIKQDTLPDEAEVLKNKILDFENYFVRKLSTNKYALQNDREAKQRFRDLESFLFSETKQAINNNYKAVDRLKTVASDKPEASNFVETGEGIAPITYADNYYRLFNGSQGDNLVKSINNFDEQKGYYTKIPSTIPDGTLEEANKAINEKFSQVKTDAIGKKGKGESLMFTDAFGNQVDVSEASGYLSQTYGGGFNVQFNENKLLDVAGLLSTKEKLFTNIGEKTRRGFEQGVARKLNEMNPLDFFKAVQDAEKGKIIDVDKARKQGKQVQFNPVFQPFVSSMQSDPEYLKLLGGENMLNLRYQMQRIDSGKPPIQGSSPLLDKIIANQDKNALQSLKRVVNVGSNLVESETLGNILNFNVNVFKKKDEETFSEQGINFSGQVGGGKEQREKEAKVSLIERVLDGVLNTEQKQQYGGEDNLDASVVAFTDKLNPTTGDIQNSTMVNKDALVNYELKKYRESNQYKTDVEAVKLAGNRFGRTIDDKEASRLALEQKNKEFRQKVNKGELSFKTNIYTIPASQFNKDNVDVYSAKSIDNSGISSQSGSFIVGNTTITFPEEILFESSPSIFGSFEVPKQNQDGSMTNRNVGFKGHNAYVTSSQLDKAKVFEDGKQVPLFQSKTWKYLKESGKVTEEKTVPESDSKQYNILQNRIGKGGEVKIYNLNIGIPTNANVVDENIQFDTQRKLASTKSVEYSNEQAVRERQIQQSINQKQNKFNQTIR